MKLLAICGMPGAGKSEVRTVFQEKGLEYIHLGATEETIRRFGKTNEKLERQVRNEMREEHGMAAMAILALPKIKQFFAEGKDVVIDNMYSWSEYKLFTKEFAPEFYTIAVHASPNIRYERLLNREVRPLTNEEAQSRDYSEIEEIEKGGPIAMADFHIVNEGKDLDVLSREVGDVYGEIFS